MATQQTPRKRRTLIKFAIEKSVYKQGKGTSTQWLTIKVPTVKDENGNIVEYTDCFYCEWLGSYGATAIEQQSKGAIDTARVRLPYVAEVLEALKTRDVKIYKNGKTDAQNTYQLNSSADNYLDSNKMIEFQVKRREEK